jgi:photosystem II stability/assembly factor-like uncharacterized protein
MITGYAQTGWYPLLNGPISPKLTGLFFINADTGYVPKNVEGLLRTTDGGVTWENTGYLGKIINFFDNNKIGIAYFAVGANIGTYKTTDFGFTWERMNGLSYIPNIYFVSDSVGYLMTLGVDTSTVLMGRTTNGGKTWSYTSILPVPAPSHVGGTTALAFRDDLHGFVTESAFVWDGSGGGDVSYHTSDGGVTWLQGGGAGYQLVPLHDSTWLSSSVSYGDLVKTFDDFVNYRYVGLNKIPSQGGCNPGFNISKSDTNNIAVMSWRDRSIYRSTDAGETWYRQLCKGYAGDFFGQGGISLPTPKVGYAVGIDSFIYKTIDGGGPPFTSSVKNPVPCDCNTTIFPNPSNSYVDISFAALPTEELLEIFDAIGRRVATAQIPANSTSYRLDVRSFSAGVYSVRVGEKVMRFIKDGP